MALQAMVANVRRTLAGSQQRHHGRWPSTERQEQVIGNLLRDAFVDDCICPCFQKGCRIVTSLFKGGSDRLRKIDRCKNDYEVKHDTLDRVLLVAISIRRMIKPSQPQLTWMPSETVRILTFEWLGLTHTCHEDLMTRWTPPRAPLIHEEIQEIQQAERHLIQQHEDLVIYFSAKYTELELPLVTFLEDLWRPRMLEVPNPEVNPVKEGDERNWCEC
ncbi:uncharacterized protein RCO7_01874 [Rhynchosporium graminicola]|uniref:Uncharacterized protein n=1 Tax=Rhynchosporium graminicola TaxID=2792576 RepID=A0A1E1K3V8_9HELO|nr:uncharacterized protein RCO7_01874 [Rhynchosporium commune]